MHHARHVIARIAIRHISADRAHIANLRVRDLQCGLTQKRHRVMEGGTGNQLMLRGHRPDRDAPTLDRDSSERRDVGKVYQMRHFRHAQFHHRDQAMASCQHTRVFTVLGQDRQRTANVPGPVIFKCCRYHQHVSPKVEYRSGEEGRAAFVHSKKA